MSEFEHRGVVEGFYGPPWSHEDRLWIIERLGAWGMNRYVYAPKDDPLHRSEWREPYPEEAMSEFRELVERGAAAGVDVGFALSPGLSIEYARADDRAALVAKLDAFRALGSRFLSLALDDVPTRLVHEPDRTAFDSLGAAHAELCCELRDALPPEVRLWVVPTDYVGTEPTDYLELLGRRLPPEVEIAWTGRTVVSPTIEAHEAARRAATLGRRILVWDNTPVSDGAMRPMLHLNPFSGRSPELGLHVSGFLLNPMQHARASAVTLRAASFYLAAPEAYDAEKAWRAAVEEIGAGDVEAFALFAEAHRFSALTPDDRDRALEAAFERACAAIAAEEGVDAALHALRAAVDARAEVAARLRDHLVDRRLAAELEPWLASHARETGRMRAAVRALETALVSGPRAGALFRLVGKLQGDPDPPVASYGPRRVLYPQITSMREDELAFGADPPLFTDRCLSDDFVRLAERVALDR